jgi:hypothetical protein
MLAGSGSVTRQGRSRPGQVISEETPSQRRLLKKTGHCENATMQAKLKEDKD